MCIDALRQVQGAMGMSVCLYTTNVFTNMYIGAAADAGCDGHGCVCIHKRCMHKSKRKCMYVLQQMQGAMGMSVGSMGGMVGGGGQGNLLWIQEQHAALHQLSKMQVGGCGWGGGGVGAGTYIHRYIQPIVYMNTYAYTCIHVDADANAALEHRWYAAAAAAAAGFGYQLLPSDKHTHAITAVGAAQGLQNGAY